MPVRVSAHLMARQLALALTLAGLCAVAVATDGRERTKQRQQLVVGVDYVVPQYKAGTKFRTPEALDTALAQDAAKRLQVSLATVLNLRPGAAAFPAKGKADVLLTTLPAASTPSSAYAIIPTGYSAGPMAIMRTDTTIKTWEQLKGKKVCVSQGGHYVGTVAAQYGATEMVKPAPADALLALRIGECDATVHDSAMLEELIKLPEWKKFSAKLPVGQRRMLAFVVPAADKRMSAELTRITRGWTVQELPATLMKKAVQSIAFEVYLDQNVPDCH